VAWRSVCLPKELGGLGVVELRRLGVALRLRWEWLHRTDPARSWSVQSALSSRLPCTSRLATVPTLCSGLIDGFMVAQSGTSLHAC
jgi:hypothetical protein